MLIIPKEVAFGVRSASDVLVIQVVTCVSSRSYVDDTQGSTFGIRPAGDVDDGCS